MKLRDLTNPVPDWNGNIWTGGHFHSGREPSSPIYDPARNGRAHAGIDLAAPLGSPIVSPGDGVVAIVGANSGAGTYITIAHRITTHPLQRTVRTLYTRHLHCVRGSVRVKVGATVAQGDRIADVGSTGASAGPHDHMDMLWDVPYADWRSGKHIDAEFVLFGVTPGNKEAGMILALQENLNANGYGPVDEDGQMGPATQQAWARMMLDARRGAGVPNHRHSNRITRRLTGPVRRPPA